MSKQFPLVALKEVLEPVSRPELVDPLKGYSLLGIRLDGRGPFLRETLAGSQSSAKTLFKVKESDFIYSRLFAWRGAFGIIEQSLNGCYVSSEFPTFKPKNEKIDIHFLNYWFRLPTTFDIVLADCTGSTPLTRNRFKENFFLALQIPLPPLEEQQRIVARVESLAAKIEEARELRKQAVEEAEAFTESSVGYILNQLRDHDKKPLKDLATKIGSGSTPTGGRAFYPNAGIPFIRSQNIRMRQFTYDGIAYIDSTTNEQMGSTQVKPNDVLLNITGASIGRVAVAPEDMIQGNVNQHVAIIRTKEEIKPRFLMYWISQPAVQSFINDEQKGATRQGFTKAQIEIMSVPLVPLYKQERLVNHLDGLQSKVDSLKRLQEETSKELDAMLPSILDKAFKGEL